MIHGEDVARAILAVHADFARAAGERWILTDLRVYDWWDVVSAWSADASLSSPSPSSPSAAVSGTAVEGQDRQERGNALPHARWVRELMDETGVRALPRSPEQLGRAMDGREFWDTFGLEPVRGRM